MDWMKRLNGDPLPWLLEPDAANPGVRLFGVRELQGAGQQSRRVRAAQRQVMESGPVPAILAAQSPEGWWVKPGQGYGPKYTGSVWSVMFLAQLGADGRDERVRRGCDYLLDHARSSLGGFSATAGATQSGVVQCLEGNLCAAMIDLGWLGDPRLDQALDWLARSVSGEGIAPSDDITAEARYLRSANCGPGFLCGANERKACAWGAVKIMLAMGKVPEPSRTPAMRDAIRVGVDFLLGCDPARAEYPTWNSAKPSLSWFRFGYPVAYVTDLLQNLEALTSLGLGADPRLANALELVLGKQDAQGRWKMEYTYNGKTWVDVEAKRLPSKWVTLRAMRVLGRASGN